MNGASGLIKAFKEVFPNSLRQRCLVHKKRNILSKVPQFAIAEVKIHLNNIYFAPDKETALRLAEEFKSKYGNLYPSAKKF